MSASSIRLPNAFYNNRFGTVGLVDETDSNKLVFDITTYRTEFGYSDRRHPDKIIWGKSLEEDVVRRDFTINAMALRPVDLVNSQDSQEEWEMELIDLVGGQSDLANKLVRTVGNPNERFSEDALRMMRAIRIATQLEFIIEENTFSSIQKNSGLIVQISRERTRDELLKILSTKYPAEGIRILKNSGLLSQVLPELERCFGVEQKSPGRHHIYDVGTHLILSLQNCPSTDPIVRLATLLHDIGKPSTFKKDEETGMITFYNHELVGTRFAREVAERLRLSKDQRSKLITLIRWHQFSVDEHQTDSALRRFIRNVGPENLEDMLSLRTGDRLGGGARETSWRLEQFKQRLVQVQQIPFQVKDLKINGLDVMRELNISPGPLVGKILNDLFDGVDLGKIPNDREILLGRLRETKIN
ncbi:MAG: tRNA adenylyl-/cytidylyl-transferase [Microgenomates group bacterium GW2011_GWA2_44_7]|nr:MAG: tRNA adenylyl-/cytidylyl-transferase [Microgenomates group bacterium GW2011_GWA2_44_7]